MIFRIAPQSSLVSGVMFCKQSFVALEARADQLEIKIMLFYFTLPERTFLELEVFLTVGRLQATVPFQVNVRLSSA